MGTCRTEVKIFEHFVLSCRFYSTQKSKNFDKLEKVDPNFLNLNAKQQSACFVIWVKMRQFSQNVITVVLNSLKNGH